MGLQTVDCTTLLVVMVSYHTLGSSMFIQVIKLSIFFKCLRGVLLGGRVSQLCFHLGLVRK